MALTRPSLPEKIIMDVNDNAEISFTCYENDNWSGYNVKITSTGVLPQIITRKTKTNVVKISKGIIESDNGNSFVFENGITYQIYIQTFNDDDVSEYSDYCMIVCYKKPTCEITNLLYKDGKYTIPAQNYLFEGKYTQDQGIEIKNFQYVLYDDNKNVLEIYEKKYDNSCSQKIEGLSPQTNYYLELKCVDQNDLLVSSGLILVYVDYEQPRITQHVYLENEKDTASVKISSPMIQILFKVDNEPPVYIGDKEIDATNNRVYLDERIDIIGNFTLKLYGRKIPTASIGEELYFLTLTSYDGGTVIQLKECEGRIHAYKTIIPYPSGEPIVSHYVSPIIDGYIQKNSYIVIQLNHVNNRIELYARVMDREYSPNDIVSYVSLGDSIAAGHTIDSDWEINYGEWSQYGVNGNAETEIVPNSYTDLIKNELSNMYGAENVSVKSFARSGDTVADLMDKMSHDVVSNEIENAEYVTICIGANDVLQPAMSHLDEYVNTGDMSSLNTNVETNLSILNDDSNEKSYRALFDKLTKLNPSAKYVFTTVYNPYKYLWIDEGNDGFFAPLLNTIPDITLYGFDIDSIIKDQLLKADMVQLLFDRVNGLCNWAEEYVTRLNDVLKNKIGEYKTINENFAIADTKTLFESFPDRLVAAEKHYNDLVSVEFTRGYDTAQVDWGQLWKDSDAVSFWTNLVMNYVSLSGLDINGFATDLINQIIEKVIIPDVDPHPETYGHSVLKQSFSNAFGWDSLKQHAITFDSNGGSGYMATQYVIGVNGIPAYTNINSQSFVPVTGYYFAGWNTKTDGTGISYSDNQVIDLSSDITLYAQWSNVYSITYKHTNKTVIYTDDETGHKECYALWIEGTEMPDLGKFSDGISPVYYYPYGTRVGVVVSNYNPTELTYDDCNCDVYWNGANVASGYRGTAYEFTLTSNVTIDFQWKISGSLATFDARSWEDCYITTS